MKLNGKGYGSLSRQAVDLFAMSFQVALQLGFVAAAGNWAEVTRLLPACPLLMLKK